MVVTSLIHQLSARPPSLRFAIMFALWSALMMVTPAVTQCLAGRVGLLNMTQEDAGIVASNQVRIYGEVSGKIVSRGHGFMITADGIGLTCAHVLADTADRHLIFPCVDFSSRFGVTSDEMIPIEIIGVSEEDDIAAFRVPGGRKNTLSADGMLLAYPVNRVPPSETLWMFAQYNPSFPERAFNTQYGCTHLAMSTMSDSLWQLDVHGEGVYCGNSGSPVMHENTSVVAGMLSAGRASRHDKNLFTTARVIPSDRLYTYLQGLGVRPNSVIPGALEDTVEVVAEVPPLCLLMEVRDSATKRPVSGVSAHLTLPKSDSIMTFHGSTGRDGWLKLPLPDLPIPCDDAACDLYRKHYDPGRHTVIFRGPGPQIRRFELEPSTGEKIRRQVRRPSLVTAVTSGVAVYLLDSRFSAELEEYHNLRGATKKEFEDKWNSVQTWRKTRNIALGIAITAGVTYLATYFL